MPLIIGGVAALIILMIAVGLSLSRNTVSVPGEQQFANQVPAPADPHINRATDAHPAYNSNPPTSGWHTGGILGRGASRPSRSPMRLPFIIWNMAA
jgi:hypothetical protein